MTKIIALVPMRHHSQRVPGKNYRFLAGKPLYEYILTSLLTCPEISEILVDTDSPVIMDGLRENFPQVRVLERPKHLQADETPMNDILLHDASQAEADFYLQTHATNPLLRGETISKAIATFQKSVPTYDSLFSVTRRQIRLWDQLSRPINHNPDILLQTQDLPPVYEENSCLYFFTRQVLEKRRNRIGERPLMFEIEPAEAWDIDTELDFLLTDSLMKARISDVD